MQPIPSNQFFGRERELEFLADVAKETKSRRAQFVVLSGEPGIGKSTLAERATTLAESTGQFVFKSKSFDGDYTPPLWLWTQLLRSAFSTRDGLDSVERLSHSERAVIARIVPEFKGPIPPVDQHSGSIQDDGGRFQLFDAVTRYFVILSESSPIVLWAEDLHWADETDLSLLEFAFEQLEHCSVLILATYRSTDVGPTSPLFRLLGQLRRTNRFNQLDLDVLSPSEMEQLIDSAATTPLEAQVVAQLAKRANGNPLFGRELARSVSEHNGERSSSAFVPQGIIEVISGRMHSLTEPQVKLLRIAAVVGREFPSDLLVRASDSEIEIAKTALLAAQDLALVSEVPEVPGTYRFSHSLIQETLESQLTPSQMALTHAQIAQAMEASPSRAQSEQISAIARHYRGAVPELGIEDAVQLTIRAGEQALNSFSFSEAADHFEWAAGSSTDKSDSQNRATVLEKMAVARLQTNTATPQKAWDVLSDAVRMYIRLGLNGQAVELASFPAVVGGMTGVVEIIEEALRVATDGTANRGWLLARYIVSQVDAARYEEAEAALNETLEIAAELGDERLRARAMVHGAQLSYRANDPELCASRGTEAIELAFTVGDPIGTFRVLDFYVEALCDLGRVSDAKRITTRAHQIGGVRPQQTWLLLRSEILLAMYMGDWDILTDKISRLPEDHLNTNAVNWWSVHAGLRSGTPRSDLYSLLDPSMSKWHIDGFHVAFSILSTWMQVQPEPELLELCEAITYDAPIVTADGELRLRALAVMMALQRGSRPNEEDISALTHTSANLVPRTDVPVDRILGAAAVANGEHVKALSHFTNAIQFCRQANFRPSLAWSHFDLIRLAETDSSICTVSQVKASVEEALELCLELDMPALGTLIRERAGTMFTEARSLPGGLSDRELEVLKLVALGKSNPEIAEALFLSRHTIVRHLSRIYDKIGVVNRTEATTYAHQNDLVSR